MVSSKFSSVSGKSIWLIVVYCSQSSVVFLFFFFFQMAFVNLRNRLGSVHY